MAAVDPQVQMPFEVAGLDGFAIPKTIIGGVAGADAGRATFISSLPRAAC